jgi:hypothetical protein
MRFGTILFASATFMASTGLAFAVDAGVTMTSSMSPDALWKKVGDFCGIASWHPAIEKCELSADGKKRTLTLKGGTVLEMLESRNDANHTYTYTIVEPGPLPVANYHSTLSVSSDPKGSAVTWTGKFDAKGASDADAKKTMDGVYEGGEKGLVGG